MAKYQIYGIGNALVDKEFEVNDDFFAANGIEKGMMTLIEEDQQHSLLKVLKDQFGLKKRAGGGSAANTIFAAQYLGAKTFYSCNVANDETGDFYVNDLTKAGIDTNLGPNRDEGVTGKCLVMVTPDAERTMNTFLGITANLGTDQIDQAALKNSEYLYIEGYLVSSDSARAAALNCKEIAEANNVKTAITFSDPAMVQFFKDGLVEMIGGGVDLLFCNEEEALLFADTQDFDVAKAKLKSIAKSFAITLGDKGALLFDGEKEISIQPNAVTALDSNGAGDNFAGAFMFAITTGYSWTVAGELASKISSQVVSQFGPRLDAADYLKIKADLL
jgi:sugar/nucleoside kinase (ribokinase family)